MDVNQETAKQCLKDRCEFFQPTPGKKYLGYCCNSFETSLCPAGQVKEAVK